MFRAIRGKETVGWAVLRLSDHDGILTGFIVDFLCRPRDTYPLLARCLETLADRGAMRVHCLHSGAAGKVAMIALGFLPRPSGWPLMIRAPRDMTIVADPSAWFITAGDADVDRPREGTVFAH
jgi:hypothetical protein